MHRSPATRAAARPAVSARLPESASTRSTGPAPSTRPALGTGPVRAVGPRYITRGRGVAERRPRGHAVPVRIPTLREVRPVGRHGLRDVPVCGGRRSPRGSRTRTARRRRAGFRDRPRACRAFVAGAGRSSRRKPCPCRALDWSRAHDHVCQPKAESRARSRAVFVTVSPTAGYAASRRSAKGP